MSIHAIGAVVKALATNPAFLVVACAMSGGEEWFGNYKWARDWFRWFFNTKDWAQKKIDEKWDQVMGLVQEVIKIGRDLVGTVPVVGGIAGKMIGTVDSAMTSLRAMFARTGAAGMAAFWLVVIFFFLKVSGR